MSKIIATRGRTFLLPGTWDSGDAFTENTSLSCTIEKQGVTHSLTATKTSGRGFQIYASNTQTTAWEKGSWSAILSRTDASFFPNGDDYVHGPESFILQVE
jgi:hypothetical protein